MHRRHNLRVFQLRLAIDALRHPRLLTILVEAFFIACDNCLFPPPPPSSHEPPYQDRNDQEKSEEANAETDASAPAQLAAVC
jgi:hypothetical protein